MHKWPPRLVSKGGRDLWHVTLWLRGAHAPGRLLFGHRRPGLSGTPHTLAGSCSSPSAQAGAYSQILSFQGTFRSWLPTNLRLRLLFAALPGDSLPEIDYIAVREQPRWLQSLDVFPWRIGPWLEACPCQCGRLHGLFQQWDFRHTVGHTLQAPMGAGQERRPKNQSIFST